MLQCFESSTSWLSSSSEAAAFAGGELLVIVPPSLTPRHFAAASLRRRYYLTFRWQRRVKDRSSFAHVPARVVTTEITGQLVRESQSHDGSSDESHPEHFPERRVHPFESRENFVHSFKALGSQLGRLQVPHRECKVRFVERRIKLDGLIHMSFHQENQVGTHRVVGFSNLIHEVLGFCDVLPRLLMLRQVAINGLRRRGSKELLQSASGRQLLRPCLIGSEFRHYLLVA